jgi:hypothetical protein
MTEIFMDEETREELLFQSLEAAEKQGFRADEVVPLLTEQALPNPKWTYFFMRKGYVPGKTHFPEVSEWPKYLELYNLYVRLHNEGIRDPHKACISDTQLCYSDSGQITLGVATARIKIRTRGAFEPFIGGHELNWWNRMRNELPLVRVKSIEIETSHIYLHDEEDLKEILEFRAKHSRKLQG